MRARSKPEADGFERGQNQALETMELLETLPAQVSVQLIMQSAAQAPSLQPHSAA